MLVELDKKGLISLLNGSTVQLDMIENNILNQYGYYSYQYERWIWSIDEESTEEELFHLYKMIRS